MKNKTKVLVVGLDGATWKVLDPLIKKGKLPFLKEIKEKGTSGVLKSTIPPLTAPAWVSFQTGVNPGKHGIFGFIDHRRADGEQVVIDARDVKSERIWQELSKDGIKSLVINMPVTHPLKKINGILVSSFLTPRGASFVSPKAFQKKLEKIGYELDILVSERYGTLPDKRLTQVERSEYLGRLIEISRKRVEAFKVLSKEYDFSFIFLLFKETDLAQHLFWGKRELEIFYNKLDAIIKELFEHYQRNFNGDKSFILISDHGFHQTPTDEFAVYSWLKKEGFTKKEVAGSKVWKIFSMVNRSLLSLGINLTKVKQISKAKKKIIKFGVSSEMKKEGILATPEGLYFIGLDEDSKQRKVVEITGLLEKLKNKGKKVFMLVKPSSEVYFGPYTNLAPDIVWIPTEDFSINTSPFTEKVFTKREKVLLGEHTADSKGVFLANGSLFPKASNQDLSIYDMYPLILYLLGANVPDGIDGKVPSFVDSDVRITGKRNVVKKTIDEEIKKLRRYG